MKTKLLDITKNEKSILEVTILMQLIDVFLVVV